MGYKCSKCGREVSASRYQSHVTSCRKTRSYYAEEDAERKFGA